MMIQLYIIFFFQFLGSFLHGSGEDTLRIIFLGDIMQHQAQLDAAHRHGWKRTNPDAYDYSAYFKHLQSRFAKADLRVANMETTFAKPPYSGYPNFNSPAALARESKEQGIDLFLSANNHICDKGRSGVEGTISLFDSLRVLYTGIFRNPEEETRKNPFVVELKGFRIAFLNYTYGTNGIPVPQPFVVKLLDSTQIKRDIERAKKADPDFIIACLHWGYEYKLEQSGEQRKWERLFNNNGVNIIVGSHPHVVQPVEVKKELSGEVQSVTAFSLGNAISNMTAVYTRVGMLLTLEFTRTAGGTKHILMPEYEYLWTSRPGGAERNFSVIPVKDFIDKPERFRQRDEYPKMVKQYLEIVKTIK